METKPCKTLVERVLKTGYVPREICTNCHRFHRKSEFKTVYVDLQPFAKITEDSHFKYYLAYSEFAVGMTEGVYETYDFHIGELLRVKKKK